MSKVFIVDDSATTRASVEYTLTEAGYSVDTSSNGPEVLSKLETSAKEASLFILDVNMPEMDGITLIREIRKLPDLKFTPILMLTTESQDSKKMEGKKAGASGWIVKPFNPEQLSSVVSRFVR